MGTKALMTVEQFAQMRPADTEAYELVEGELVPLSSGTLRHAKIRSRLERLLNAYFDQNPPGEAYGEVYSEVDCRVGRDTVRRPDLSVFLAESLHQIDLDEIPVPFAPAIAVEVLSPSESAIDVRRKVRDYLSAGSQEVWLLDPTNAEVQIHTSSGIRILQPGDSLASPVLPGFGVGVADLVVIS